MFTARCQNSQVGSESGLPSKFEFDTHENIFIALSTPTHTALSALKCTLFFLPLYIENLLCSTGLHLTEIFDRFTEIACGVCRRGDMESSSMTMDPRRILEAVDRRNGVAAKRSLDWQPTTRGCNNKERSWGWGFTQPWIQDLAQSERLGEG